MTVVQVGAFAAIAVVVAMFSIASYQLLITGFVASLDASEQEHNSPRQAGLLRRSRSAYAMSVACALGAVAVSVVALVLR